MRQGHHRPRPGGAGRVGEDRLPLGTSGTWVLWGFCADLHANNQDMPGLSSAIHYFQYGGCESLGKKENHNKDQQPTTNNQKPTTDNRQHISRHVSDASATTAATSPAQQQHLLHGSNSSNKCCISLGLAHWIRLGAEENTTYF